MMSWLRDSFPNVGADANLTASRNQLKLLELSYEGLGEAVERLIISPRPWLTKGGSEVERRIEVADRRLGTKSYQ